MYGAGAGLLKIAAGTFPSYLIFTFFSLFLLLLFFLHFYNFYNFLQLLIYYLVNFLYPIIVTFRKYFTLGKLV